MREIMENEPKGNKKGAHGKRPREPKSEMGISWPRKVKWAYLEFCLPVVY